MGALAEVGKIVGGLVGGYVLRLIEERTRSKRARADKTHDEHRQALSKLVGPIRDALRHADRFITACTDSTVEAMPTSAKLGEHTRKVLQAWEQNDVRPLVTDPEKQDAIKQAQLHRHAKRWDDAVANKHLTEIKVGKAGWDDYVRQCEPVAVELRNALNGLRVAISKYVVTE